MITTALIDYIKNQNNKNVSREAIIARLAKVGWHIEDIEEGLAKAIPLVENKKDYQIDPYHEPVDLELDPLATKMVKKVESIESEIKKTEPPKIWIPQAIKPVEEVEAKREEAVIKPVSTRTLETFSIELDKPKEMSKTSLPVKPIKKEIKTDNTQIEMIPELTPKPTPKVEETVVPKPEELRAEEISITEETPKTEKQEASSLSKIAMISSYSRDYMSANKLKQEVLKRRKNTLLKWLIVILLICILGGIAFVFEEGYLKLPEINIPFVKKDSKSLLLNGLANFSTIPSYKVKTQAVVSSSSLANITSGLMQGESLNSKDKDTFSFGITGKIDKGNSASPLFDYDINISSSILENTINTNLKSNDNTYFINIPDLKLVFGFNNISPEGLVSFAPDQANQIKKILPLNIQEKIKNINLAEVLKNPNLEYLNGGSTISFKNFISQSKFIKKGEQEINGIVTYHYSIETERISFKKLLSEVLDTILLDLSQVEKTNIEEKLGFISVNSLEVWIGKKDDNLYQYKFTLAVPLSKVIGLEDKGIANDEVNLDWQTTYYDLNVPNEIIIPTAITPIDSFLNNVEDLKIKNAISSFFPLTQLMKNALGSYGNKSNITGSCLEPAPGSLFSPLGHSKGASTVVGTIASTMNTIVGLTKGNSLCYSTPKAWAIASPLASDSNSYFCLDSVGNSTILATPISKAVCQ